MTVVVKGRSPTNAAEVGTDAIGPAKGRTETGTTTETENGGATEMVSVIEAIESAMTATGTETAKIENIERRDAEGPRMTDLMNVPSERGTTMVLTLPCRPLHRQPGCPY